MEYGLTYATSTRAEALSFILAKSFRKFNQNMQTFKRILSLISIRARLN